MPTKRPDKGIHPKALSRNTRPRRHRKEPPPAPCKHFKPHKPPKPCRIERIGEPTMDDAPQRPGTRKRIQPREVCLHAGTRVGAAVLGIQGVRRVPKKDLPRELRRMSCAELESNLCICKGGLAKLRRKGLL